MKEPFNGEGRVIRLEETESTNLYLKQLLRQRRMEEGTIVLTDYQTRGRGQVGNRWVSAKGENLLFSLVIYPPSLKAANQFVISRIISLAVKQTLDQFVDDIRIKWPNDIYHKDRKIAGILIESDISGSCIDNTVIGIGLNVNQTEFPDDLPNPVSLRGVTGAIYDRDHILSLFRREFFRLYGDWKGGGAKTIEETYMLYLYRREGYHAYEDGQGRFMAKIEDVLSSGHLVLKVKDTGEERRYAFKEVAFIDIKSHASSIRP